MEADRRLWANVCLLHLKLLNYSLINKFRLQLAQPCKMRLHPVSIQSISIVPLLNQEQFVTVIS